LLPEIRRRTDADLRRPGLPREKALAAIVHLLESTLIRVGNDEYARDNKSFGLTTLRDRHVEVDGASLRFKFRGKSGKEHAVGIRDRRLASTIRRMRDLPGQELCQYLDDNGDGQPLGSGDVNDYLRDITGRDVTAKDFRTWAGTLLAAVILHDAGPPDSAADARRTIVQTVEMVADRLGNTPAIARKCYIHPFVLDAFTEGHAIQPRTPRRSPGEHDLSPQEAALMRFLRDAPGAA
jgi:DNA topoisomerase-1